MHKTFQFKLGNLELCAIMLRFPELIHGDKGGEDIITLHLIHRVAVTKLIRI